EQAFEPGHQLVHLLLDIAGHRVERLDRSWLVGVGATKGPPHAPGEPPASRPTGGCRRLRLVLRRHALDGEGSQTLLEDELVGRPAVARPVGVIFGPVGAPGVTHDEVTPTGGVLVVAVAEQAHSVAAAAALAGERSA